MVSEIRELLGEVPLTMLTLYQASSGGIDWITIFDQIRPVGTSLQVIFTTFLALFNFAVFSILSGVFSRRRLILNTEPDRNAEALGKRRRDREDADALLLLMSLTI